MPSARGRCAATAGEGRLFVLGLPDGFVEDLDLQQQ